MSFFFIVPRDIWYMISKFLTFEQILLISLVGGSPYPESSYVFREYYEQEIGGTVKQNYKQETIRISDKTINLSSQDLFRFSCLNGHIGLLKTSINRGAVINYRNFSGPRAAALWGRLEVVEYLSKLEPKIISLVNYELLKKAARYEHIDVVNFLTKIDPEGIKANNYEALKWAAEKEKHEVVKHLLSAGADISVLNHEQQRFYSS